MAEDDSPDSAYAALPPPDRKHDLVSSQNLACTRCRQRKIRCNRGNPCSQCVRAQSRCSYPPIYKPREKRQRVLISAQYEEKIDYIAEKLDLLAQRVDLWSRNVPAPSPTVQSSHALSVSDPPQGPTMEGSVPGLSKEEYEGESSLSAHALFATRFLQEVINHNHHPTHVVQEMTSVLDALQGVIKEQKQQRGALENIYPLAQRMAPGSTTRDLPMPPAEVAMACLRMGQEYPWVQCFWLLEFVSIAQFMDYFIRVYAPGPVSDADLIIVNCSLFHLFTDCTDLVTDPSVVQTYLAQASRCQQNLETILSILPFHTPVTLDFVYAMNMAGTYCLQLGKTSAAWDFITKASHLCQSLGLHSAHSMSHDSFEARGQKSQLFWTVYTMERNLSLRLGRSSTFRDQDVTVPRSTAFQDPNSASVLNPMLSRWIDIAVLQGRTYDEIYSPGALIQLVSVRVSRARNLAAELQKVLDTADPFEKRYNEGRRRAIGEPMHELMWRAERVSNLSLLSLIYRGIPPAQPSKTAFCDECVATARQALREHEQCISVITNARLAASHLEMYLNWGLLQSPFFPFIVLFCRIVETSASDDLQSLGAVVQTLQSTSQSAFYRTFDKQIRLFRALYDVARKYVEMKAESGIAPAKTAEAMPATGGAMEADIRRDIGDELGAELGAELGTWFYESHEMLRLLDDSYL